MRAKNRRLWSRFGQLVRRLRVEKGLGLRELSKRAAALTGGRGLSASYLSTIERGGTAPPRKPVLRALAMLLEVPPEKLELAAEGWTVLDMAEVLQPFPEYAPLLERIRSREADLDSVAASLIDAWKRHPLASGRKQTVMRIGGGTVQYVFAFRATDE